MSGTASSGRVLTKASNPPGTTVAGPVPKSCAWIMASAIRSKRMTSRNRLVLVGPREHDEHREMVLQIGADRQVDDRRDAEFAQVIGRPDARQHQQLRRIERAAAEDHLAPRLGMVRMSVLDEIDAGRRRAAEHDLCRLGAGLDGEVAPLHHRMQEGDGGRRAPAAADRILAAAETHRFLGIEILGRGQPERLAGFDPGLEQGSRAGELHLQRTRAAAIGILGQQQVAWRCWCWGLWQRLSRRGLVWANGINRCVGQILDERQNGNKHVEDRIDLEHKHGHTV